MQIRYCVFVVMTLKMVVRLLPHLILHASVLTLLRLMMRRGARFVLKKAKTSVQAKVYVVMRIRVIISPPIVLPTRVRPI